MKEKFKKCISGERGKFSKPYYITYISSKGSNLGLPLMQDTRDHPWNNRGKNLRKWAGEQKANDDA